MLAIITLIGKAVLAGLKLFGRKGSALPGLIVEKIYPAYLAQMLEQLPNGVIVVTGTNGKTTTTKAISQLLRANGWRVLSNPSGGNFVRGIISSVVGKATADGRLNYDVAVFEQDEAHGVKFVEQFRPNGVVALNVTRDQLDRFGEIDTTAELIGKIVAAAKDWVVLNANDRRVAGLAKQLDHQKVTWFGHSESLKADFPDDDQMHAKERVKFFAAAKPDVSLEKIAGSKLTFKIQSNSRSVSAPLDGAQNALNLAAALAAYISAVPDADIDLAVNALAQIEPAFGRGETIALPSGGNLKLQLVKNPASFRHSLALLSKQAYDTVGIVINDDYADGRDVSWLWDVDFDGLKKGKKQIICGGIRAYDMANRLKYDEIKTTKIEPEFSNFLTSFTDTPGESVIFCTYTAMLKLRKLLKKQIPELGKEGI